MKLLKEVFPGSIVKVERNSLMEDWIVVEQSEAITTILRKNSIFQKRYNSTGPTYEGSEIDNWLSDEATGFLSEFSAAMQMKIVSKAIKTNVFGEPETIIVRRAFLPSEEELDTVLTSGERNTKSWLYPLMTANHIISYAMMTTDDNGVTRDYYTRTPATAFSVITVHVPGVFGTASPSATNIAVRPAIAVSGDCLVGDDNVLLPDDDKPYREVELIGIADHMSYRPTVARVEVNAVNLYDVEVQVTNNAKDETPVWVDAVGGNTVEFTNTEKTSELWELGVRIYGKSDGIGYFTEPIIIIKEDTGNG